MKSHPIIYFIISILFISILLSLPLFYSISNLDIKFKSSTKEKNPLQAAPDCWPTSNWRFASPESQGISLGKIEEMENYIENQNLESSIDSILVVRNGYLVYESYPSGHNENFIHHIYSCTKVFTSALVGIAIEEGYISGINDFVLNYFPNKTFGNMDARKQAITINHLLTMTSGLRWVDQTNFYQMQVTSDWVKYILDQPMDYQPGDVWNYNTGCSHLLSAILNAVTPNGTRIYAIEKIFNPLNITNYSWSNDPQGIPIGGTLLYLSPRDMAKFGFLYLHNGMWNNSQLITSNWVSQSKISSKSIEFDQGHGSGYGYQWWIYNWANAYTARGSYEQYIVVIPDLNMVVVSTGNTDFHFVELLVNYILPSAGFYPLNIALILSIIIITISISILLIFIYFHKKRKKN